MSNLLAKLNIQDWLSILRWNKPSGRLILLIPAGWSLWMSPSAPPNISLVFSIVLGGLLVSAGGCIANDIWDSKIDKSVSRTANRPLPAGKIKASSALILMFLCFLLSLFVVINLPNHTRGVSLRLAILALPLIILYPSAKRWFPFPQAILAICWGFAVLIPWGAMEGNLNGGIPLTGIWLGTILWTFGFDTAYAMADRVDDKNLGLNSSAINLGRYAELSVSIAYFLASIFIGLGAYASNIKFIFWPIWLIFSLGMQYESYILKKDKLKKNIYGIHFRNQVYLGSFLLLGLILGRIYF